VIRVIRVSQRDFFTVVSVIRHGERFALLQPRQPLGHALPQPFRGRA